MSKEKKITEKQIKIQYLEYKIRMLKQIHKVGYKTKIIPENIIEYPEFKKLISKEVKDGC